MSKEASTKKARHSKSETSATEYFKSEDGESLSITISPSGLVIIQAAKIDKNTTLGSIVVSGLTPKQASAKAKGFWGKLWAKIKKVANDLIDAVTFTAGPFTCRPSASVGFQGGQVNSVTVGISCRD